MIYKNNSLSWLFMVQYDLIKKNQIRVFEDWFVFSSRFITCFSGVRWVGGFLYFQFNNMSLSASKNTNWTKIYWVFDHFRKAAFTPQVLRGLNPEGLASAEPLTKAEMCWDSVVPVLLLWLELLFLILFINFTVSDTNHNNVLSFLRDYRSAIAVIKTWTYKQESLFSHYANVMTSKSSTDPIFYWTFFSASEGYVFGQVCFVASSIFPKLVYQYKLHLEYFSVARGTVCGWLLVWETVWNITTWIKTIWHMYPMIHYGKLDPLRG